MKREMKIQKNFKLVENYSLLRLNIFEIRIDNLIRHSGIT